MRRLLTSPRWLGLHLLAIAAVATCLALGVWQWQRAHEAGGGAQNLGYALQWPLFAGFVCYFWWRLVREALASTGHTNRATPVPPPVRAAPSARADRARPQMVTDDAPAEDAALAEYNRYLAALNGSRSDGEQEQESHR